MSFWTLVFAFSLALTLDRVTRFLFRRLGTYIANRAWDRATREPIRPVKIVPCYLCGELVKCNGPDVCREPLHVHPSCFEEYGEAVKNDRVCAGGRPDA